MNVCIYRMPREESLVSPGSHCPKCQKPICWHDNIPFLSYLALFGRCRFCKEKISPRYFLVELLSALFFLVFFIRHGLSLDFFFYAVFVSGLIVATFVDIRHRIIPDEITLGGIVVGFVLSSAKGLSLRPASYDLRPAVDSFLGIIFGGGIIWLIGFLFDLVYFKLLKHGPVDGESESMGGGDVKLLAMIGAFLGWKLALATFFIAPFIGVAVGLPNLLLRKKHVIPYGPFLSLAAVLCVLWPQMIFRILPFLFLGRRF